MKQRAIKRCLKRAKKQLDRGTYRGRMATLAPNMAGAMFAMTGCSAVLQPQPDDCRWAFRNGEPLCDGHKHWFVRGYNAAVAVSYAGR